MSSSTFLIYTGFILQSLIRIFSVSAAMYLFSGSNDDILTVRGVSSIISSTHVSLSK
ncbi:MAG: hypothetical protein ACOZBL_02540 [Patescibacteria group bacterium]